MKMLVLTLSVCSLTACTVGQLEDVATATDEQPIIGGTTDTGDPCVVAVFAHAAGSASGSICTGTVIGPHTVLTAAHCVDPRIVGANQVTEILSGTTCAFPGIVASSTTFDAAWDPNNLPACHDFGIIHTADALPFPVCSVGAFSASQPLRLVGYGTNTHMNGGACTKRQATVNVVSSNAVLFQDGTSNKQTCHGDSGGPAFQGSAVVGTTSFGSDPVPGVLVCFGGGSHCRVDSGLSFITPNTF